MSRAGAKPPGSTMCTTRVMSRGQLTDDRGMSRSARYAPTAALARSTPGAGTFPNWEKKGSASIMMGAEAPPGCAGHSMRSPPGRAGAAPSGRISTVLICFPFWHLGGRRRRSR